MAQTAHHHEPLLGRNGDDPKPLTRTQPYDKWSWPSQFLFVYVVPVLLVGSRNGRLDMDDVPRLASRDEPSRAFVDFERLEGDSILMRLLAQYWVPWLYSGLLVLLATVGTLGTPFVMHRFLTVLSEGAPTVTTYLWALALGSCAALTALTLHKVRRWCWRGAGLACAERHAP